MLVPPWDWYDQQDRVLKILHSHRDDDHLGCFTASEDRSLISCCLLTVSGSDAVDRHPHDLAGRSRLGPEHDFHVARDLLPGGKRSSKNSLRVLLSVRWTQFSFRGARQGP
jgi:hypothetical protein